MSDVTVAQFAEVLKVPVDRLLVQLESAGIQVEGPQALISDEAKLKFLRALETSPAFKDVKVESQVFSEPQEGTGDLDHLHVQLTAVYVRS